MVRGFDTEIVGEKVHYLNNPSSSRGRGGYGAPEEGNFIEILDVLPTNYTLDIEKTNLGSDYDDTVFNLTANEVAEELRDIRTQGIEDNLGRKSGSALAIYGDPAQVELKVRYHGKHGNFTEIDRDVEPDPRSDLMVNVVAENLDVDEVSAALEGVTESGVRLE